MDWLWANKDWLFAGLGIAIIAAIYNALKFLRNRSKPPNVANGARLQAVIDSPAPSPTTTHVPPTNLALDPDAVVKAIKSAPLLQQADVEKHYRGIRVAWSGELQSADKTAENEVRMLLRCSSQHVMFSIDPAQYSGLGLLHSGDRVRISGVIEDARSPIIKLSDVRLTEYGQKK